ncbi:sulfotransferase family 2 domain-containing protein [Bacillus sp. JJ1562]|uniref:sulfotransferase family 2 domain-containing protein n=1 Tax=Bacillus sp. JJ1562 TaxID=3122960 RepID=UPI00300300DB
MTKNETPLLIFMHIQKTAGSTLRSILNKEFGKENTWFGRTLDELPKDRIDELKCVGGHFEYGIHENFTRPYTYLTMLREPVDRVLSYYYFLKNNPARSKYDEVINMDLDMFLQNYKKQTSNYQTKRIAGGEINLEKAKQNLISDFSFIGLTERFDESLELMKKVYGLPNFKYKKSRNITQNRPSKQETPKSVIKMIEEHNELDIKLYQFVSKLFEQRLSQ